MTKILTTLLLFLSLVSMSAFGYFFMLTKQAEVRNQAIADCAAAYRYSFSESSGATITVPVSDKFDECLQLKHIEK
ncbi:MAG: hypothetical protein GW762_04605 [Candidatus Pacebacteria bacterium]|nr:hypothetical protein [Candidatus Paceibacterota bacterium]PIR64075.1 MAG: hypothetical protein COU64_01495 [Candidatus Pacebacteria bacterium CG10_big_fil_rev_8_21_14_0_10_40_26]PIZ78179.1 MAG: hypothetical protein COY01_05345 [Candidatus Pacebacteria bacterium CG_4_10_14_0_2_um_filter_40_20]PJA69151.1 MAG: hypothetical protein CO156_02315 [Candidatus Pacebacteria bacterium CG_4_9_14_3_um_filter_40_12]PJC41716.1 MAG: hypothetical protein CO041_03290 [Candidatus Pacebacteria bacterium CG_4_9_